MESINVLAPLGPGFEGEGPRADPSPPGMLGHASWHLGPTSGQSVAEIKSQVCGGSGHSTPVSTADLKAPVFRHRDDDACLPRTELGCGHGAPVTLQLG